MTRSAGDSPLAEKIEKLGYNMLWIPEGFGLEPFAHAAQLLAHTKRLIIATGIAENLGARSLSLHEWDHFGIKRDSN